MRTREVVAIHERSAFRERAPVFHDRAHAGEVLARMLADLGLHEPLVLAIPAGGVPVAVPIARANDWDLDLAVVSKVTLPWNREAGYGAVAFDGTERLNRALIDAIGLDDETIERGLAKTRQKVALRVARLRAGSVAIEGRDVVLVDDGLASGFTMRVAALAVRKARPSRLVAAVPTGHRDAVLRLGEQVDDVVCPNVRSPTPFAVAAAYERWADVLDLEVESLLAS